jgi:diguanylate cyclase (GGDEF)-like protein
MAVDRPDRTPTMLEYGPFAAAAALAWVAVIVGSSIDWPEYLLAAALLGLTGVLQLTALLGSRRSRTLPALVFLAAVGLLRNSAGGSSSGLAIVALIPVFYLALYGEGRRELYIVLVGMAVFYLAPIILVGPPAYPNTQYRAAFLSVAVGSIIGLATQSLMAEVRLKAGEAKHRERMLAEVSEVLRSLHSSSQARLDVCEAVLRIGDAISALLYEPVADSGLMRSSAIAGPDHSPVEIPAGRRAAVIDAFDSGEPILINEDIEAHVGNHKGWEATGRPDSVLFEPLMRGRDPIGVLVVGWTGRIEATDPRLTVVQLLAHEAAGVIIRADMMSQLTDMARTDPLTGLLNRRAWDARVDRALNDGHKLTIAMLDLDHFKKYNDTHGHPAGDRLLKETAAMWRAQLRNEDLLARLGGEEFGLLLLDCDTTQAVEVIERLRNTIYGDRTCSAGFAERLPGEPAEKVMARADLALYKAKTSGRDRACMSPASRVVLAAPTPRVMDRRRAGSLSR